MNLVVFHGGNYAIASKKLEEIKSTFEHDAITQLSLKSISFEQFLIEIRTPSLFTDKRLIVVDDADEKKVKLDLLNEDESLTLVLVFNKELSSNSELLKIAGKKRAQVFVFSQPQDKSVFQFLDYVADKNREGALAGFEQLYVQFGGQYLLTMLLYLLRKLVMPVNGQAYGAAKIERQKKNFSQREIVDCYFEILETDYLIKSGKAEEKTGLLLLIQKLVI